MAIFYLHALNHVQELGLGGFFPSVQVQTNVITLPTIGKLFQDPFPATDENDNYMLNSVVFMYIIWCLFPY